MQVITSISDVQDKLLQCYAGPDKEMFKEIAPWCCRCDKLAIRPYNCFSCQTAVICGTCYDQGARISETCEETMVNDASTQDCKPCSIGIKILDRAQFKCVFKCNPKKVPATLYTPDELEKHLLTDCPLVPVKCTQNCGEIVLRKQLKEHI